MSSFKKDSLVKTEANDGQLVDKDLVTNIPYTRRQKIIIALFAFMIFNIGVGHSLVAPLYPILAAQKEATSSQNGLVFGIFYLVMFTMCPIYGMFVSRIGAKCLMSSGVIVVGITYCLFGFVEYSPPGTVFTAISFLVQILEAMGSAAEMTAAFSIVAQEFPKRVATVVATMESFYGLGCILGYAIGGTLYTVGGFQLPFMLVGGLISFSGILACLFLPKIETISSEDHIYPFKAGWKLLQIPSVVLSCITVFSQCVSQGFMDATLESHLSQFNLTGFLLGLGFLMNSTMYAVAAPVWGNLVDRYGHAQLYMIIGYILIIISYMFFGPSPFLPYPSKFWLVIFASVIHGIGAGAQLVPPFMDILNSAKLSGMPDNIATYGLVSSLWCCMLSFGAFLGPIFGGILLDYVGYRMATLLPWVLHIVVGLMFSIYIFINRKNI